MHSFVGAGFANVLTLVVGLHPFEDEKANSGFPASVEQSTA